MKTTKKILSEQILRKIAVYDQSVTDEIDEREVFQIIDQVANALAKEGVLKSISKHGSNSIAGVYKTRFKNVAVLKDEDTDEFFATLPSKYLDLPNGKGIDKVSAMKGNSTPFIPVPSHFISVYNDLYAGDLQGQIGYYSEGEKIYFLKNPCVDSLLVTLIISGSEAIDINSEYPISPEEEINIIDEVFKRFIADNKAANNAK